MDTNKKTRSAQDGETGFGDLPVHVLTNILAFLSQSDIARAMKTCRAFNIAAQTPFLWKSVALNLRNPGIIEFTKSYAAKHVEEIDATECVSHIANYIECRDLVSLANMLLLWCPKVTLYLGPGDWEWTRAKYEVAETDQWEEWQLCGGDSFE